MSPPGRPRGPRASSPRSLLPGSILALSFAGCGLGGGDAGTLDLTKTPPAAEVPSPVKGKPATQPLDTTPN